MKQPELKTGGETMMKIKRIRQKLTDMKISRKLAFTFTAAAAVSVILAGLGIYGMVHSRATEAGMQMRIESMPLISNVLTNIATVQSAGSSAAPISGNAAELEKVSQSLSQYDQLYRQNDTKL